MALETLFVTATISFFFFFLCQIKVWEFDFYLLVGLSLVW